MDKIKIIIKNLDFDEQNIYNFLGTKKEGILSYSEDDSCKVTITTLEDSTIITRENDDVIMKMEFKKNDEKVLGKYYIKSLDSEIKLETFTHEYNVLDNNIYIVYQLILNDEEVINYEYTCQIEK